MITTVHVCSACGGKNIKKNGTAPNGKQKFHCNDCKFYGVLNPEPVYSEDKREEIIRAYQDRASLRGVARIFDVARQTVARWIKKKSKIYPILASR